MRTIRFFIYLSLSLALPSCASVLYAQGSVQSEPQVVVLVHGLMRTYQSMGPMKIVLERHGYHVYNYSYTSPKYTIHEHSIHLHNYLQKVLADNSGAKINFVTHSLGGIITREALSMLSPTQLKSIGSLIMLSPPNQGSSMAKLSTKLIPFFTFPIKPLKELSSDESSYVHRVPIPKVKMGIIAGRFDAKVPPSATRLQGQAEPVIINSNHTFIMTDAQTKKLVLNFLDKGSFD